MMHIKSYDEGHAALFSGELCLGVCESYNAACAFKAIIKSKRSFNRYTVVNHETGKVYTYGSFETLARYQPAIVAELETMGNNALSVLFHKSFVPSGNGALTGIHTGDYSIYHVSWDTVERINYDLSYFRKILAKSN